MRQKNRRPVLVAATMIALAAFALHGCESPTAPKFPPPVEEEPADTTDEEGGGSVRGRAHGTPDGHTAQRRAEFVIPSCREFPCR
jgi:hypothetical protein